MDVEYTQLQELIESTIDTEVNKRVGLVEEENSNLKVEVCRLKNKISDLTDTLSKSRSNESMSAIMLDIVNQLNYRIQETEDKYKKEDFIYNFLELLFKPDFNESTYEVPTWLGAVVNYYSNREFVIQVLNLLHVKMPDNITKFRLPIHWKSKFCNIIRHLNMK